MAEPVNQTMYDEDGMNILDYCRVIWKYRYYIGALCLASILSSFVYSLLVPKLYQAQATILAPKEIGIGGGKNFNIRGGTAEAILGAIGYKGVSSSPTRDSFMALLKSRTMREEVIARFKKTWGPSVQSRIGNIHFPRSKDGTIIISAEALGPQLAAEVANYYFENLTLMLARRAKNTASLQREYYLRHLDQARADLKRSQDALIKFQEENRYIALAPAIKSAIGAQAVQAGSVMTLEMERNLKQMYLTDQHPEMIALNRRIFETKRLVSHNLYGEAQPLPPEKRGSPPRKEYFVAATKMTPLQFEMVKVFRDLKFWESIESGIHQNLKSLIYNIQNPPVIYIDWLDRAIPPARPFKPAVGYNVAAAGIGSLVVGILLALFLEYIERIKSMEKLRQRTANSQ